MQLTKFTDYSLRCLVYLSARKDSYVSIRTISDYYNISYEHLTKVVHNLSNLGYVESKKGKNGGVKLLADASKLRLGDLVEILEPNMNLVECFDKKTNTCKIINNCKLKHCLYDAKKEFINSLNQYSLQDVVI